MDKIWLYTLLFFWFLATNHTSWVKQSKQIQKRHKAVTPSLPVDVQLKRPVVLSEVLPQPAVGVLQHQSPVERCPYHGILKKVLQKVPLYRSPQNLRRSQTLSKQSIIYIPNYNFVCTQICWSTYDKLGISLNNAQDRYFHHSVNPPICFEISDLPSKRHRLLLWGSPISGDSSFHWTSSVSCSLGCTSPDLHSGIELSVVLVLSWFLLS